MLSNKWQESLEGLGYLWLYRNFSLQCSWRKSVCLVRGWKTAIHTEHTMPSADPHGGCLAAPDVETSGEELERQSSFATTFEDGIRGDGGIVQSPKRRKLGLGLTEGVRSMYGVK